MIKYVESVKKRGKIKYLIGYLNRIIPYLIFKYRRFRIRRKGGVIGNTSTVNSCVVKVANKNLSIGESSMIWDSTIDTRASVKIGNNVIIGKNNNILTNSHNIDSKEWENKKYGIVIEDFVWISTNCTILPSCRHIGKGAVIGAGSVVVKNVPDFAVVSGNPAQIIRYRKCLHEDLVVESIHLGDLKRYNY